VAETKGWDKILTCPATHPVQPWTFVELKEGVELRWRFWVPSQFDVYGPQFRAKATTVTKAVASKKVTITCVKRKLTKKVTAIKPKCPAGYKRK
jgi:hypothetical protein